jgi:hypothetical protein
MVGARWQCPLIQGYQTSSMMSEALTKAKRCEMTRLFSVFAGVAGLLMLSVSLLAHHGQAGYNTTETVTVSGTITGFQFVNPHSIVGLDVKDEKGETQAWQGELTSPNHLVRAGWTPTTMKPGDQVTMSGYRAKSGANSMWITKISVNGEQLKMGAGN